jgi:signal transduction histidine kinase
MNFIILINNTIRSAKRVLFLVICSVSMLGNFACSRPHESGNNKKSGNASSHDLAQKLIHSGDSNLRFNKDSSFIYYSTALKLAHEQNLEFIKPQAYYNLAIIYEDASDLRMAALYLDSAKAASIEMKDFEWLSNTYNALGNLKFDMLDSSNSRSYFDSAYLIAKRHSLPRQTGIALASCTKFEPDGNVKIKSLKSAIQTLRLESGNDEEIALIYVNLGLNFSNPDTAMKYYQMAISIARKVKSPEIEMAAYNNMVYCYLDKQQPKEAEECLISNAIPIAERNGNYDWLSTLYDTYSDVLIAMNKPMEAFSYEKLALNSRVKADGLAAKSQVRLLSLLLDLKNNQILIEKQQTEVRQKDYKIRLIFLWGSISLLIILTIISVYIWFQQRGKIRMQAALIDSAKHLIEAEENMKGRVSLELHDLVTPFYTSMVREIDQAGIPEQRIAERLRIKVTDLSQSLRNLSHRMNNNFREQLSLPVLLKGLCDDFRKVSDIPVDFFADGFDNELTDEEIIHLYRIVQELFSNALKYLNTGEIKLSLSENTGTIFIFYSDTGPGFDSNTASANGIGIRNIIERARIINGKAVLTTSPGNGTSWRIAVPR